MSPKKKRCPRCGATKPAAAFHVITLRSGPQAGTQRLGPRCRPCNVAYRMEWKRRDTPQARAYNARASAHNSKRYRLKKFVRDVLDLPAPNFFSAARRHNIGTK